ncbi:MAG: rod shape-determining protein MreC [Bacillota bacterium]
MFRRGNTRKYLLLGVLIIFIIVLMNYTRFGRAGVSPVESALRDVVAPVQGLSINLGHRLRGLVSFPFSLVNAAKENQLMKERIGELEGRIYQDEELRSENERLKRLLDFKTVVAPQAGFNTVTAAVVGRDPGNWFGMITINKGSRNGLKPDMAVINDQGLVGRITSVNTYTAEVLLITDFRSGVSALIQDSRSPGIVEGTAGYPGKVRMVHIPIETEVTPGQVVLTSGFGSMYPKGIPIGRIQELGRDSSGLFNTAEVIPFVDFNRLEEVMVITGTGAQAGGVSALPDPWGVALNNSVAAPPTGVKNPAGSSGVVGQ